MQQQSSTTSTSENWLSTILKRIQFPISELMFISERSEMSSIVISLYRYPSIKPPPQSLQSFSLLEHPLKKILRK